MRAEQQIGVTVDQQVGSMVEGPRFVARSSIGRRLLPLWLLFPMPFWVAESVRSGDWSAWPLAVVVLAVVAAAGAWVGWRPAVGVSRRGLIIRTLDKTVTLPWSDITTLAVQGRDVVASTTSGSWVLPLPAQHRVPDGAGRGCTLGELVISWWSTHRGEEWAVGAQQWVPTCDVRGRVVLRAPAVTRFVDAAPAFAALWGTTLWPTRPLGATLIGTIAVALLFVTLFGAAQWWSRVIVDDYSVVVYSFSHRVVRLDRDRIQSVEEVPARRGRRLQVVLGLSGGAGVRLPGLVDRRSWYDRDVSYEPKRDWLLSELVIRDRARQSAPT